MPCPVSMTSTALKVTGAASLGLLAGTSLTSTLALPAIIAASAPTSATPNLAYTIGPILKSLSCTQVSLSTLSGLSFVAAWALAPLRRRHPYLIWSALLVGVGNVAVLLPSFGFYPTSTRACKKKTSIGPSSSSPSSPSSSSAAPGKKHKTTPQNAKTSSRGKPSSSSAAGSDDISSSTMEFSRIEVPNSDDESGHSADDSVYNVGRRGQSHSSTPDVGAGAGAGAGADSATTSPTALDPRTPTAASFGAERARSAVEQEQAIQTVKLGVWGLSLLTALVGLWGER